MEGELLKWAGYFSGWVEKYFVLHSGTLYCYASKNDRLNGTPAIDNLKMGLCEIAIDPNIKTQWELRVPTESKIWHLKSESASFRQKWIQALGSAKACLLGSTSINYLNKTLENTVPLEVGGSSQLFENYTDRSSVDSQAGLSTTSTESKSAVVVNEVSESKDNSFVESYESDGETSDDELDMRVLLLSKCSDIKSNIILLETALTDAAQKKPNELKAILTDVEVSAGNLLQTIKLFEENNIVHEVDAVEVQDEDEEKSEEENKEKANCDVDILSVRTFFSSYDASFYEVYLACVERDGKHLVPCDEFLDACKYCVQFFNRFAGTVLTPLRTDIQGNITKIQNARGSDTEKFYFLQDIVEHEISNNNHTGPNTATQASIWLTRSLRVLSHFLENLLNSDSDTKRDPPAALWIAYSQYLAKHHNWMVQRLFKMGLKMLPNFDTFCNDMMNEGGCEDNNLKEELYEVIARHGLEYSAHMHTIAKYLRESFDGHGLEV